MNSDKDEDYVDPSTGTGRSRPSYEKARPAVEHRQGMVQQADNTYRFTSAIDPNIKHNLDNKGREKVPNHRGKGGFVWQKPALDHQIQFAALQEAYDEMVTKERKKPKLTRRSSLDLGTAFSDAVADPSQLRLVTHEEHKKHGGNQHRGTFSASQKRKAEVLIASHMPTTPTSQDAKRARSFSDNRPKWATPSQITVTGPTRRSTRNRKQTTFFDPK